MVLDTSMSVLVVDDSRTIVHLICDLLRKIGFKDVDGVHGGTTALANMKTRRYGLVISDWHMEPMNGLELLRQVRSDPGLDKIPFLFVTTEARQKNVIDAVEGGANNFIIKPFDKAVLKAKIEAIFGVK
jgi:two-component system, chemotaxis family, chemotaxis protein CheY